MNFMTAVRNTHTKEIMYYEGHTKGIRTMMDIPGEVLEVYVGTYDNNGPLPQVVLADALPPPGTMDETFELAFRGPREMAIEIFEGYAGMLP